MGILIENIGQLVTNCADPNNAAAPISAIGELGIIENAAVVVDDEHHISWVGPASELSACGIDLTGYKKVDVQGRALMPGFVDSHTHLVFDGDRGSEFEARMMGERYDGGGIMLSVSRTRAASSELLHANTERLVRECRAQGTTTLEIKSGYGLTVEDELKMLRVAAAFTDEVTFLGAHVVPAEWAHDRAGYINLVCGEMLDAVVADGHARWADIFCEPASPSAFTGEETRTVLSAYAKSGLSIRVHGAQLSYGPGPALACEFDAASVDHCTFLSDDDLECLASTWSDPAKHGTVATFLPAVEFSTKQPYPDMARAVRAGTVVSLATDCNPGTCFSTSMPLCVALAVRDMGLTPAQAVWAATAGGAIALRRNDIGAVRVGARADFAILDAPSYIHLAYRPGVPIAATLEI